MPKKVPPKNFQIAFLKRIFRLLNPTADPEEIDWEHTVDETLTIPENREKLAKAYPGYRWFKEPEKIKEYEDLDLDIDWLEHVVSEAAIRPEDREEALKILDELRRRAVEAEELKKEIAKLKKKIKEAPPPPPPPPPPKPDIREIVRSRRFKGQCEEIYRRWDEYTREEQETFLKAIEALPEEERIALFKEEPWAEKIWLEKKPKPIGTEVCPEGLIDVKEKPKTYWIRNHWVYAAYDIIDKGYLWFCQSTGSFYEQTPQGTFKRIPPEELVKRLKKLIPKEAREEARIRPLIEAPRLVVTMPKTAPEKEIKIPLAYFFQRYPEAIKETIDSSLRPDMTYLDVKELIKSLYGWEYDEYRAAGWYYYHCRKRGWKPPEWVKKALGL
jgi:hypothetical protein